MPVSGNKLVNLADLKVVYDAKLDKNFSSLTALSGTPATGDLVPIKSGNDTYKIDYNALASAILGQISSNGVVNVANGGTGSNSATGALSGLIGALDTSSGFSLSDTIPVSINGTAYTITGLMLSNVIVGGGTGVTATLPIVNGGTGAASASAARTALDVYSKSEVTTAISQSTANYLVKSTYFSVAGNGGNYTIHAQNAFIVSAKNEADTINGCAVFVTNLGGALRRTDIYGGNQVDVTYSDGSLTITNRAGSWVTFMVFYS